MGTCVALASVYVFVVPFFKFSIWRMQNEVIGILECLDLML